AKAREAAAKADEAAAKARGKQAEAEAEEARIRAERARVQAAGADALADFEQQYRDALASVAEVAGRAAEEKAAKEQTPLARAHKRLRAAQGTVETARSKLEEVGANDEVTDSFTAELDVLAEMALGLRRRCEELADG